MLQPDFASSGHRVGQLVGDWWEEFVVLPLLKAAADKLALYLDCRFVARKFRSGTKINWEDSTGNVVDYDFVLEIGGDTNAVGIPVAFVESFWRRGLRHSKDKARDDTNKLLPMRATYPTARFLSIAACGEFSTPAADYVRTREVDLFHIPKPAIVEAFGRCGIEIDYPDQLPEPQKAEIALQLFARYSPKLGYEIAQELRKIVGANTMDGYTKRVYSALGALPHTLQISQAKLYSPISFTTVQQASEYLANPTAILEGPRTQFQYSVQYTDGSRFSTDYLPLEDVRGIHGMTQTYVDHMSSIANDG